MKAELPEKREYELSERYNRGERQGANEEERTLFAAYDRLREGLRTLPAPEIDQRRLAEAMKREMRANREQSKSGWPWLTGMRAPRAAAAVVLIGCALCLVFLLGPRPAAMLEARFEDANGTATAPSWWWQLQAGFGLPVRTPSDQTAKVTLKDGSVVICQPGTVTTFAHRTQRLISLSSGEVTVQAEHDSDAPFTVSTPLGDAKVVGTVFHVRILSAPSASRR